MPGKQVRIALDSSYLIALVSDWHEGHLRTLRSFQGRLEEHSKLLIPAHAIIECYSVLTRIPAPFRISTEVAKQLIEGNFSQIATITELKASAIWGLLENLAHHGVGGGQVYDAAVLASAAEAGATVMLTWNAKHFRTIAPIGIEICEP